ncbi:diiron oxygenase [Mesoterricola silvestris]|uniref:p-aminobenzoate N-oxygenase AurF n=1 Tax=Mesoterricola silvestris TaxID=2927979 RepID=A0AA48GZ62_9BACT|nr:diiron oxygenase [Mesoterricola silvestris]BDU73048.1 hypothetical protein METEAL_22220 [Mesoterricola silvestris]
MTADTYAECLTRSYRVGWKIKEVLGFVDFDPDRPWLPAPLSGAYGLTCLGPGEKLRMTHVEMGSYAHLFGFVEAFIAPEMVNLAQECGTAHPAAFEALTNFASEEIKHIHLFREIRNRVDEQLGFPLQLLEGEVEVARAVLGRRKGAVLLLTSAIEWLTQEHYTRTMKNADELDPLTREIFRAHWLEESQHARLDHLEALRVFRSLDEAARDATVEDFIWLLAAMDGLLQTQALLDLANVERHLERVFDEAERLEVHGGLLRAKRYAFLESGVTHPEFQDLFQLVTTPSQRDRVQAALGPILLAFPAP